MTLEAHPIDLMLFVLARRLFNVVPTLLAVIALIFLLFSVLPGSFISGMNEDGRSPIDPAVMERMRKEMGLDDPLPLRFAKYVANLATGRSEERRVGKECRSRW